MSEQNAFESLVIDRLKELAAGQDLMTASVSELKDEIVAVGSTAERTLNQATKTNGRVDALEATVALLKSFHHDADLVAATRKEQVEEVKAKAFGLVRALDHPIVTGAIIAALGLVGWVIGHGWPL